MQAFSALHEFFGLGEQTAVAGDAYDVFDVVSITPTKQKIAAEATVRADGKAGSWPDLPQSFR